MENKISNWNIGAIVALKTHPFFVGSDNQYIILGGDPQLGSPLMMIAEKLREVRTHFDENTGNQLQEDGDFNYRCIWFSSKSNTIEEAWIAERLLKIIEIDSKSTVDSSLKKYGTHVLLKTVNIELGKKKSTLNIKSDNPNNKAKNINALLTFSSPVMQVIGTVKVEIKDSIIDPKTGIQRRFHSNLYIKCKYYNAISDKFSESLIPIECLEQVEIIGEEIIRKIKEQINKGKYLVIKKENGQETLIKPLSVSHRSGRYYLEGMDYLKNRTSEFLISNDFEAIENALVVKDGELPKFGKDDGKQGIITFIGIDYENLLAFNDLTIRGSKTTIDKQFWLIEYVDQNEKYTKRTVSDISLLLDESDKDGELTKTWYINGYCYLRGDNRYFRVDRVKSIKVLNIVND